MGISADVLQLIPEILLTGGLLVLLIFGAFRDEDAEPSVNRLVIALLAVVAILVVIRDAEKVRYNTFGRKALVGLDTGNSYYARVINPHTVKLHKTTGDALAGINTVTFTDYGSGTHSFESISGKLVLNSIVITDPGSGYENKQRTCDSVGVNTALDIINIKDHDYKSGEIIQYSPDLGSSSVAITGLSTSTDYYVMLKALSSLSSETLQESAPIRR